MASKPRRVEPLPMNFQISLAERMRAAHGLPAYIRRRRRIEDLEVATIQALDELYREALAQHGPDMGAVEESFRDSAHELNLTLLNDLIDRHNKYYPIEANLPTDIHTHQFLQAGELWKPLTPLTIEDLIDRMRNARGDSLQGS